MEYNETILSGALLAALPVALFGGLVSFFSPCVLPLVPGYLSYVTGVGGADLQDARRGRMFLGALLFVLGFSTVFVTTGAFFGGIGAEFLEHQDVLNRVFGALTILLGLAFTGLLPRLTQREIRFHLRPAVGLAGAPMLGLVFGIGWIPCVGPTLAAVQFLAFSEATAGRGALLTLVYCLGLGLPFIIAALAFRRTLGAFAWVKRHYVWVMRLGGVMLITTGLLLVTGLWADVVYEMQVWSSDFTVWI
ncbi:cytochrome c biogenesis CcdA family protein [Streptomyces litchfieldiae]|uniref:Cytochrome c biogenesis protein CcdA n=1 Tax=Streptomyces litchfieldiae TaxID=3075543 RepID=A0ABU2MS29_9ACTN|nr:cytochrome c biogenesis protein CcdA [Streptomyces sp. DSM 44938]MDT0343419.1 cytochrome c biogenesis protein CcdA [Streptomyces sp. DSM 44938]